jgi:hypothetical protein
MKRKLAAVALMGLVGVMGAAPAAQADEHHPPKFGVKEKQCEGGSNHPNCPGSH